MLLLLAVSATIGCALHGGPGTGESVIRNVMVGIGWTGGGAPSIGQVSLEPEPPETLKVDV